MYLCSRNEKEITEASEAVYVRHKGAVYIQKHTLLPKLQRHNRMEELVLSIPLQDVTFIETLAKRMG